MKVESVIVGFSGGRVLIAVTNPFAGRRWRYTLWSLSLSGYDTGGGTPVVLGREITLTHCRQIAKAHRTTAP